MATISTEAPRRANGDRPEGTIRSLIPARLDRLGWSRFHTRLVIALGVAWVLDGLEITIASNAEGLISQKQALNLSSSEVAFAVGTVYLLGEVVGALFFGRLSDKFGRRNLFMITLGVYLFGGVLTALTFGHSPGWSYWLWASRFIAGMGIGGEYAAINSAIDELIPAKYRGRVDIAVNGTYWGGALIGTLFFIFVVNHLPVSYSWRVAFLVGPALGFVILFVRKNLPESPRWLLMHGRVEEAEAAVAQIEELTQETGGTLGDIDESKAIEITPANNIGFVALARTLFVHYPRRAILGATLMITQSFLYNAIFFTYALVLTKIYNVPATDTAYYSQTACWCVIFFFASAGASSAYLTVSEIFPVEVRAKAIAVFFAIAQSFGAFGPWLYGELIGNGQDHFRLFIGYLIGAGVMLIGGVVAAFFGIDAEQKSLEDIAQPLSAVRPSSHLSAVTGAPRSPAARSTLG
jgi:MFS family permease